MKTNYFDESSRKIGERMVFWSLKPVGSRTESGAGAAARGLCSKAHISFAHVLRSASGCFVWRSSVCGQGSTFGAPQPCVGFRPPIFNRTLRTNSPRFLLSDGNTTDSDGPNLCQKSGGSPLFYPSPRVLAPAI